MFLKRNKIKRKDGRKNKKTKIRLGILVKKFLLSKKKGVLSAFFCKKKLSLTKKPIKIKRIQVKTAKKTH